MLLPWGTGLWAVKRLICRIESSIMNGVRASQGRQAEVAPSWPATWSRNSTRAGDSSSASWKSLSWEK